MSLLVGLIMAAKNTVIEVRNVSKTYGNKNVGGEHFYAVKDVSLKVYQGESYGLVGESGSGKSTMARLIMHLLDKTSGEILIDSRSVSSLSGDDLRDFRRNIQMVFQDPYASLNPRMTILETLTDCLSFHKIGTVESRRETAFSVLEQVALGTSFAYRYPHELSGGQCQRVGIARAIILEPKVIVLDEPVSALDVSVQAQILNLLHRIQRERKLTYFFISHDLNVVKHICDRVGIMRAGVLLEEGDSHHVFNNPKQPYTKSLVTAALDINPDEKLQFRING